MKNCSKEEILGIIIANKSSKVMQNIYLRKLCKRSGLCPV